MNDCHSRHEQRELTEVRRSQSRGTPARDAPGGRDRRAPDGEEHWGDTGLALHLAGTPAASGAHLENVVLHDLLAWRDGRLDRAEIFYWRTAIGEEVDLVIEAGGSLLPIEVKATSRPRLGDTSHIRTFHQEYGRSARAGLLLHTGSAVAWLAPRVLAAPWWRVL